MIAGRGRVCGGFRGHGGQVLLGIGAICQTRRRARSQARVVLCFSGDLRAARERRQKPFSASLAAVDASTTQQPPPARACASWRCRAG